MNKFVSKGKKQADNILVFINQKYNMNLIYSALEEVIRKDISNQISQIHLLIANNLLKFTSHEIVERKHRKI